MDFPESADESRRWSWTVADMGGGGLKLAQCDTAPGPGLLMERWRLGVPTQRFYLFWIKTTFSFVDCGGTLWMEKF